MRTIALAGLAAFGLAGCDSYTSLSDSELAVRVMREMTEASPSYTACSSSMLSGDDSACKEAKQRFEKIHEMVEYACSRSETSPACQAKAPVERLLTMIDKAGALARGDFSALNRPGSENAQQAQSEAPPAKTPQQQGWEATSLRSQSVTPVTPDPVEGRVQTTPEYPSTAFDEDGSVPSNEADMTWRPQEHADLSTAIRPLAEPASWITTDDYPSAAARNGEQGRARYSLVVGADGRATSCEIINSSGSENLDQTTCHIVTRRARFAPARNSLGEPVSARYNGVVRWTLPG